MRYITALSVFLLTVPIALPSQELFVPFVSKISVERKGDLIRLSWVDSPDIYGPVYIYRSFEPLDTQYPQLAGIKAIEIPYGTQSYTDEIERSVSLYYFIVASAETGERYPIVLPYSNSIVVSAHDGDSASSEINIFSLDAVARGEGVSLSYRSIDSRKSTVLYRSSHPITQKSDLVSARIINLNIPVPFMDYPVPGFPCYYALVFAEDLEAGTVEIIPGYNATVEPVTLPARQSLKLRDYEVSLPLLTMPAAVPDAPALLPASTLPLSKEAEQALEPLLRKGMEKGAAAPHEPQILEADFSTPRESEDYTLYSIVHGAFTAHDWQTAQSELRAFMRLPQSAELEQRAHFYLGQIYFFLGLLPDALFEFLAIRNKFPDESYQWIMHVLTAMVA
ncbi:MAG: hypothetical protein LBO67_01935 [Spirochaetaceae bacterium]|jgi:hypothetical protein|nr:hypothetical protein [Spirochaetaceae bacterium]